MSKPAPKNNLLQFAIIFFIVYFSSQLVIQFFFPDFNQKEPPTGIALELVDNSVSLGNHPEVRLINNTSAAIVFTEPCPTFPFTVTKQNGDSQVVLVPGSDIRCEQYTLPTSVQPGDRAVISLAPWKYALFNEVGQYTIAYKDAAADVQMKQPNVLVDIFRTFIMKPLLNALILIASWLPGYSLGGAIIILTLAIKLLLFIPTQSALKGQKKMQEIQPKIEALRKKHKNDPQALNKATLALWKTEKVNPFQSCAPLLVQFPVLLGLFYVIRDGINLNTTQHLVYDVFKNIDWTFGTQFLGLNLLESNWTILPILLVALQFSQLKLSFARVKANKAKKDVIDITPKANKKKDKGNAMDDAQQMQQKLMLYGLPIMIGVFALQFPAAVGLYWAVSTGFAIAQQLVVNNVLEK